MNKPSRHTKGRRARPDGPASESDQKPLLGKDGKVDPAALFRAAKAEPAAPLPAAPQPVPRVSPLPPVVAPASDPADISATADIGGDEDLLERVDPKERIAAPVAGSPNPQKVSFTLQHDLAKRLDKYLCDRITFMSRSKLQELIEGGSVLVNGRVAKSSTVLRVRDSVVVNIPAPPSEDFEPQDIPLDVMYEDEHLIVLNKQAGIIVHPARTHTHGTMINALAYHFRYRSETGGHLSGVGSQFARPGVVHRLDRFTSGVIVFAKTDQAHWNIANQFMARTVNKRYVAIAHGKVTPPIDLIDLPLGPHVSRRKGLREMQQVRHDALGKPALTLYRVLGVYGDPDKPLKDSMAPLVARPEPPAAQPKGLPGAPSIASQWSLLEIELKTGRTHQIRVHMSHQGFPLVGDDMYGGKPFPLRGREPFARQALHAAVLGFRHPITGEPMLFQAPLPDDLRALLKTLRRMPREEGPVEGATLAIDEL